MKMSTSWHFWPKQHTFFTLWSFNQEKILDCTMWFVLFKLNFYNLRMIICDTRSPVSSTLTLTLTPAYRTMWQTHTDSVRWFSNQNECCMLKLAAALCAVFSGKIDCCFSFEKRREKNNKISNGIEWSEKPKKELMVKMKNWSSNRIMTNMKATRDKERASERAYLKRTKKIREKM